MPVAANDEAIRQRAYEIWEHEGRKDGNDQEYWYRAESEFGRVPSNNWDQGDPQEEMDDAGVAAAAGAKQRGRTDG